MKTNAREKQQRTTMSPFKELLQIIIIRKKREKEIVKNRDKTFFFAFEICRLQTNS